MNLFLGGVRIARKEKLLEGAAAKEQKTGKTDEENEEWEEKIRQTSTAPTPSTLAEQTKKDYPEEAVKAFHGTFSGNAQ